MITKQLSEWLRAKADELDGTNFPDALGDTNLKTVVAALGLAEERFEITMYLKHGDKYTKNDKSTAVRFCIEDAKSVDYRGDTLAEAYRAYLEGKKPKLPAIEVAEAALAGIETPAF